MRGQKDRGTERAGETPQSRDKRGEKQGQLNRRSRRWAQMTKFREARSRSSGGRAPQNPASLSLILKVNWNNEGGLGGGGLPNSGKGLFILGWKTPGETSVISSCFWHPSGVPVRLGPVSGGRFAKSPKRPPATVCNPFGIRIPGGCLDRGRTG